jgi:Glycosyltransferase Family 4
MLSWELLHSICVGGVGVHVTELAAALERKGHELHVFTRMGVVNLSMRASTAYTTIAARSFCAAGDLSGDLIRGEHEIHAAGSDGVARQAVVLGGFILGKRDSTCGLDLLQPQPLRDAPYYGRFRLLRTSTGS